MLPRRYFAVSILAGVVALSGASADTPNALAPDERSTEALTAFFESCLPDDRKGPLDRPPRLEGRQCGCMTDWVSSNPEVLELFGALAAQPTDEARLRKLVNDRPDFLSAAERCKSFARSTSQKQRIDRSPFTPRGAVPAEVLTARFWGCFKKKRVPTRPGLETMRECGCLLDADRAGLARTGTVIATCEALGRAATTR